MKGRVWIILAGLAYAAVVGCVIWPGDAGRNSAAADSPRVVPEPSRLAGSSTAYRGMALQIQRIDGEGLEYRKAIDGIADLGADAVEMVVDSRQENGTASMIFLDVRMTPGTEQLTSLIKYAKSKGLRVMVMPIVLLQNPRGNEWRGTIKPEVWEDWFNSYREMVLHYARICEAGGADLFVVGSELVSTEPHQEEWLHTIRAVRSVFHGQLTYSSNWDHFTYVGFWDKLDFVGMNTYWKLGDDHNVSVDEIMKRWKAIQQNVLTFTHKTKRPLLFTEVGWCSVANAAHEPWDYTKITEPLDLELQRKLYEGFFRVWQGSPDLAGFSIWQYAINQGGPQDRGYMPVGKPAEKVLREWLAKPKWTVNTNF